MGDFFRSIAAIFSLLILPGSAIAQISEFNWQPRPMQSGEIAKDAGKTELGQPIPRVLILISLSVLAIIVIAAMIAFTFSRRLLGQFPGAPPGGFGSPSSGDFGPLPR